MPFPRAHRRVAASVLVAAWTLGTLLAPALHLATHRNDHDHRVDAAAVDLDTLRNGDGQVDLGRLAAALGRNVHAQKHARGERHGHETPAKKPDPSHGRGALSHFAVALHASPALPVTPPPHAFTTLEKPPLAIAAPTLPLQFLATQRAQAPPHA